MYPKDCSIWSAAILFFATALFVSLWTTVPSLATQYQPGESIHPPVRIAIIIDKSLSTVPHGIPSCQTADLEPLFELVSARGGEIGVGTILTRSNSPLIRLYIPSPPESPLDSSQAETNVFRISQARSGFAVKMSCYDSVCSERRNQLQTGILFFKRRLDSLFSEPAKAKLSDVMGALKRADTFLAESDEAWSCPALKFVILCTDGEHTAGTASRFVPKSGATIIIVPGGRRGILSSLNPVEFENLPAAVRFVLAKANAPAATLQTR
jgi:hypothetical protein